MDEAHTGDMSQTKDRAYYAERLRTHLAKAEAELARIEGRVFEAREQGIDTSKVVPPSAQSSDMTLAKAEGAVEFARKVLADYEARS